MLKKLTSLLLAICMLFCLCACGTTETSSNPTNTLSESQTDTVEDNDENTFNEENSQVSSNIEESTENYTTQTQPSTNQSKPTSTSNQPTHTHSYSNATCTSPKKCSCGATAGTTLGHQFSSATCTSPKICSRCGTTSGNALGHSYSAANCNSPKTCTRCGQTSGGALGHNYVSGKCSRCNVIDPNWEVALFELEPFDSSDMFSKRTDRYDTYGNFYDKSLSFGHMNKWHVDKAEATYRIANKYSNFCGTISYWDCSKDGYGDNYMHGNLTIKIYMDNNMIYMKDNITKWTEPIEFSLDITGCNFLKIVVYNSSDNNYAYLNLGNAKLKK